MRKRAKWLISFEARRENRDEVLTTRRVKEREVRRHKTVRWDPLMSREEKKFVWQQCEMRISCGESEGMASEDMQRREGQRWRVGAGLDVA